MSLGSLVENDENISADSVVMIIMIVMKMIVTMMVMSLWRRSG